MKVEEQVQFLQNHKTGICVGTPARLMDLLDNGKFDSNLSAHQGTFD
jgi:superfamily II DNA/RNA helicase